MTAAEDPRLGIAVTAPPENGAANRAAGAALAAAPGVPAAAITLRARASRRDRRLVVSGDPAVPGARLALL